MKCAKRINALLFALVSMAGLPDGTIKKIWPKVKPEEHADEVLAAL
jgi:hypothetical protein